ncbi:glycosyltransferase family 4 protein [Dechloromonas sp. ZS-1]|uniref:glycosyltransferase family 4 protein n=1 Tax=Dechloromonas sp. ZS-1 TaxID=3138067 RepID=UPI0031FC868C
MKILLVSEDLPAAKLGGLAKQLIALGNALIDAGHEVTLMGRDSPSYDDECNKEMGFRGPFISGFGNPFKGWKEIQLGFFNPLKRPYFARHIAEAIRRLGKDFDVVHYHGHHPMVGYYIPQKINFIQTRHDQGGDCIIDTRFRDGGVCVDRSPFACAKCIHSNPGFFRTIISAIAVNRYRKETERAYALHPVIFVSDFLRRNYLRTMPNSRFLNSKIIHNFYDEGCLLRVREKALRTEPSGEIGIHVAGRFVLEKGIAQLLDLLVPRLPTGWSINICGDGPLRKESERKYASSRVRFLGHISQQETLLSAANSSVCIVPSVWEEAFGLVTLEALRLGKTCFALARGGTPELMRYADVGQLQLFDDLQQLVNSLLAERTFKSYSNGSPSDVETHLTELMAIYQRNQKERA